MVYYDLNKIKLAFDVQYDIFVLTLIYLLSGLCLKNHCSGLGLGFKDHLPGLGLEDHWPSP